MSDRTDKIVEKDAVRIDANRHEPRIGPVRAALHRLREKAKSKTLPRGFVSDELIAERRAEAALGG